jgi:hypothetical protein
VVRVLGQTAWVLILVGSSLNCEYQENHFTFLCSSFCAYLIGLSCTLAAHIGKFSTVLVS